MRRWILLLLVLLVPLRVWAGLDMSIQMAADLGHAPTDAAATDAAHPGMPADCHMMAGHAEHSPASDTSGTQCQVCELCAPLGAGVLAALVPGATNRTESPPGGAAQFTSAERRHALDPPRP